MRERIGRYTVGLVMLVGVSGGLWACRPPTVRSGVAEVEVIGPAKAAPALEEAQPASQAARVTAEEVVREDPVAVPVPIPTLSTPPGPHRSDRQLLNAASALRDIWFGFDSSALGPTAQAQIERNAKQLQAVTGWTLTLEGRADERGTEAYNLVLSQRRAERVHTYLVGLGIHDSSVTAVSYGTARPLCREHVESCWQVNRSVRFVLEEGR